jgi:hypothetical protein
MLGLAAKSIFSTVGLPSGVTLPPMPNPPKAVGSCRPVPGLGATRELFFQCGGGVGAAGGPPVDPDADTDVTDVDAPPTDAPPLPVRAAVPPPGVLFPDADAHAPLLPELAGRSRSITLANAVLTAPAAPPMVLLLCHSGTGASSIMSSESVSLLAASQREPSWRGSSSSSSSSPTISGKRPRVQRVLRRWRGVSGKTDGEELMRR